MTYLFFLFSSNLWKDKGKPTEQAKPQFHKLVKWLEDNGGEWEYKGETTTIILHTQPIAKKWIEDWNFSKVHIHKDWF